MKKKKSNTKNDFRALQLERNTSSKITKNLRNSKIKIRSSIDL